MTQTRFAVGPCSARRGGGERLLEGRHAARSHRGREHPGTLARLLQLVPLHLPLAAARAAACCCVLLCRLLLLLSSQPVACSHRLWICGVLLAPLGSPIGLSHWVQVDHNRSVCKIDAVRPWAPPSDGPAETSRIPSEFGIGWRSSRCCSWSYWPHWSCHSHQAYTSGPAQPQSQRSPRTKASSPVWPCPPVSTRRASCNRSARQSPHSP